MRDFKSYLKRVRRASPASVNLALAGVDHFYRFLGAGRPDVRREELAQAAPRALLPEELRAADEQRPLAGALQLLAPRAAIIRRWAT